MDVGAKEIRQWHKNQGWSDIGYHYVIKRSGEIEPGRPEKDVGAHAQGANANSIGICLVGGVNQDDFTKAEDNFTEEQFESLQKLVSDLRQRYKMPVQNIIGHRDVPGTKKACPSFDVKRWVKDNGIR